MDTQKLYNWNKQQNDMNINVLEDPVEKKEAQELNDALIQNKQMDEIGKNIFESDQIKDVSKDDTVIEDKREDIAVHLPPTAGIFSQKQSLIRENAYENYQSRVKANFRKNPNGTAEKVGITTYLNTKIIHPKYYLEV